MAVSVGGPETMVDLGRYPLLDLGGRSATAVVTTARAALATTGAAELDGFIGPAAIGALVVDAEAMAARAHHSEGLGTAYLDMPDMDMPEHHPRRWFSRYAVKAVAYDLIPKMSPLRQLYEWDPLLRFIEAIVDRGPIYRYQDPFGALNLAVMADGDELQWHFDQADFVVSLAIQDAVDGGNFEVAPLIRSSSDEGYDDVAAVLGGDRSAVVRFPMTPGTLLIFAGRDSLHRVSPIWGDRLRHVGLLAYDTKPGTVGTDLLRMSRYGRTEPLREPPA